MRFFNRRKHNLAAFANFEPWWKTVQWDRTYIAVEAVWGLLVLILALGAAGGYYFAPAKVTVVEKIVEKKVVIESPAVVPALQPAPFMPLTSTESTSQSAFTVPSIEQHNNEKE